MYKRALRLKGRKVSKALSQHDLQSNPYIPFGIGTAFALDAKHTRHAVSNIRKEQVMLVLSRKVEQQIQIGDGIVITILQVKGNQVRIGIDAPRNVRVLRRELEPKSEEQPVSPSKMSEHDMRATDDRVFTIVRRSNEFATAERSRPNESPKAEAASADLQLRLSRRSSMSALRGLVLPRR